MSDKSEEVGRRARALARRNWPVRKLRLGDEPGDDLSATTTAEERLVMMWPLAVEAWSLTGRQSLDRPTREEVFVRIAELPPIRLDPQPADILREDRDRR